MSATGLLSITLAMVPRQKAPARTFFAANSARRMPLADDTYDHFFCSCQHSLLKKARHDSDNCRRLLPVPTELDRRLLPALPQLQGSEDGHRIYHGNWNTSKITQLDQVLQPADTVPALSESLLALSKHFVNKIDTIWAARHYKRSTKSMALTTTPEVDPATTQCLQRRCYKPRLPSAVSSLAIYVPFGLVMSLASTRPGRRRSPRPSAFTLILRDSLLDRKQRGLYGHDIGS